MTKTKIKYTEKFQEIYDDDNKQLLVRTFGHVILDNNKKVDLLVIAEIYDLLNSGAVREDEIPENGPVMLTFSILPIEKHISPKHKQAAIDCGGSSNTLENIYEYMGGLRFEPSKQVWFKTNEEALAHISTMEFEQQITAQGMLSGFTMDMYYNRAGETNWDILNKIMNGK